MALDLKIRPCLWFDTEAEAAAEHYVSIFPNSKILHISRYGETGMREAGMVMTVEFELDGIGFTALNGGPQFPHSEAAISFMLGCEDSAEVDHYWDKLSDGGKPGQCGWVTDKFGVPWQVIPKGMGEVLGDPDRERADRAMEAMLKMTKLDLDAMRAAADGETPR